MDTLASPLVILAITLTIAIFTLRHYWLGFDWLWSICICITCLLLISLYAYTRAQKHFESRADTLIRIESYSHLHSTLTAAENKKSSWPPIPDKIEAGIRWNYPRLLLPLLGSLALVVASFTVPVDPIVPTLPSAAPRAWERLSTSLEELKQKSIVQDQYIKEIENKLNELKEQPEKDWYSHSSLEATENLTSFHSQEIQRLSNNLQKAERSLGSLKKQSRNLTEAQRTKLMEQFNNTAKAMQHGSLKPDKELLDTLQKLDPSLLSNLSEEETQKLREQMKDMSAELQQQLRDGLQPGDQLDEEAQDNLPENQAGDGQGGLERGPGHVPKVLGHEADKLKGTGIKKIDPNKDRKTTPGNLLETTHGGKHDVDTSSSTQQPGGNTGHEGEGGESVWKGNYLPEEKKALKNFFK